MRVFRDESSLSVSPQLWPSIQRALAASRFLILLTSPEAAQSKWIAKELQEWLTRDAHGQRLLLVLTSGTLAWNEQATDFDPALSTALPSALRGVFEHEPRYIDFSWAREEEQLDLRNPRFRALVAQLAGPIHGRHVDEMEGEDVRQHRRTNRIVRATIATLTTLTVVAGSAAVIAAQQRQEAIAQRQEALRQLALATSRELAATAELRSRRDMQSAMLLSTAAFAIGDTQEARTNLARQLNQGRHVEKFLPGPGPGWDKVSLSPDGRSLTAIDQGSGAVAVQDLTRTQEPLRTLPGVSGALSAVISPNGELIAVTQPDNITVWNVTNTSLVAAFDAPDSGSPDFSPDGRILAIPGMETEGRPYPVGKTTLWDIGRHKPLGDLVGDAGQVTCHFSPDGTTIATAQGADITLWSVSSRTPIRTLTGGHDRGVFDLAFSPDSTMLASGGHDARLIVWDIATGDQLASRTHDGDVNTVAFTPDGRTLAAGDNAAGITVYDIADRTDMKGKTRLTGGHTSAVTQLVTTSDSRKVISYGDDGRLIVWTLAAQTPLILARSPGTGSEYAGNPVFSPDSRTLAIPTEAGVVLWDIARRQRLTTLPESGHHPAFSPDGRTLVTISGANVLLWDTARRTQKTTLPGAAFGNAASPGAVFSPDGRILAVPSGPSVILWDFGTLRKLGTLDARDADDVVHGLAFSPDGRTLVTGGYGHTSIDFWDVAERTRRSSLPSGSGDPVSALSFSPSGDLLAWNALESPNTAIGGDFSIVIWDTKANSRRATYTVHNGLGRTVAFSPDGRILTSDGAGVHLWSLEQGEQIISLADPSETDPAHPRGPVFSPDGRMLATTGSDNHVTLWDIDPASWSRRLCAIAGRDLSLAEWQSAHIGQPHRRICFSE
ncbi:toll/interleukin-1 receptor domain-containing protein [Nonomuraea sp. NPDC048882]|uniref:toll/interleukin-1 receptor domain-containing protein n=1 Tax=Nonomuraea sp. NPDC048882 TaxID=3154347 RepID=UPI0033D0DE8C